MKKEQATQPITDKDKPATSVGDVVKAKKKQLNKSKNNFINCPKCNRAYKKQESLDNHVMTCDGSTGAGRPEGSMNENTRKLMEVKKEVQQQIAGKAHTLVAAQLRMAVGQHRLFMREKVPMGTLKRGKAAKGNEKYVWKVSRVTLDADFMIYLGLDHDQYGRAKDKDTGIEYFYEITGEGNHQALMNLLDRAFGKPKENVELGEDPDNPLTPIDGGTSELRKKFRAFMLESTKARPKEAKSAN